MFRRFIILWYINIFLICNFYLFELVDPEVGLLNKGEDCWNHCSGQGPCSWCGSGGYCCTQKFGWTDVSNGCDGTFGGQTKHECSKPSKHFVGNVKYQNITSILIIDRYA